MPGGAMLTGPAESVGRANEVPPGMTELNHPGELLHPRFLTQIGIKTHADVANQQTAFCRHLNALIIHIHQPIFCQRCQQRQIVGKITLEIQLPPRFYRRKIEMELANQRLNNVTCPAPGGQQRRFSSGQGRAPDYGGREYRPTGFRRSAG